MSRPSGGEGGGISWTDTPTPDGRSNLSVEVDYDRFDDGAASAELATALEGDQTGAADFEEACVLMAGRKCFPGEERKRDAWLGLGVTAARIAGPERHTPEEWREIAMDALAIWSELRRSGKSEQALRQAEVVALALVRAGALMK